MENTDPAHVMTRALKNWWNSVAALEGLARKRSKTNPPHVKEAIETLFDICVEEEQDAWERYTEIRNAIIPR